MCTSEAEVVAEEGAPGEGFISIFNGKDLTGWTVEPDNGTFSV